MKLLCYALHDDAPPLVPASPKRAFMDAFPDRHAYRCLPLAIANAHGWEVLCPVPIEVDWNGGPKKTDLEVRALKPLAAGRPVEHFCRSNFSRGIVTFHLDYIFRTEPEWDLLATGSFNAPKDNAYPLTGIIETDWLPYPFTMNWQILRPGRVRFEAGEPFCLIVPIPKQALLDCQPEIHRLADNPELAREHDAFRTAREEFLARWQQGDSATIKQAWQRYYFTGRHPDGKQAPNHLGKLRLREPTDLRPAVAEPAIQPAAVAPAKTTKPLATAGRWERGSLLDDIESGQTEANEIGRRQIDREGRLASFEGVYLVADETDAKGRDFLVAEKHISPKDCTILCAAFQELEGLTFKSDKIDPYWNDRFIWYADIASRKPEAGRIMIDALRRAVERVARFYQLKVPLHPDLLQIVRWKAGLFMAPHADNANPDGSPHAMAGRDLAGIIYLNDDYQGGELYFTAHDIAIKPRQGMLAAFTAGFHHEHAVLRVTSGTRLTMPFFLRFEETYADKRLLADMKAGR